MRPTGVKWPRCSRRSGAVPRGTDLTRWPRLHRKGSFDWPSSRGKVTRIWNNRTVDILASLPAPPRLTPLPNRRTFTAPPQEIPARSDELGVATSCLRRRAASWLAGGGAPTQCELSELTRFPELRPGVQVPPKPAHSFRFPPPS